MSTPYESDLDDLHEAPSREREISLGAGTVLGIFLALAAVCGVFFAFGYTVGRRSVAKPLTVGVETAVAAPTAAVGGMASTGNGGLTPKPSPGSLAGGSSTTPVASSGAAATGTGATTAAAAPTAVVDAGASAGEASGAPAPVVVVKKPKPATTAADGAVVGDALPALTAAPAATTPAAGGAPVMVQVAAVSHREDADLLLTALRQKGYQAMVRSGAQDSLMHIQVGPFASKKEAEAMRQRLMGDGFNAILK